MNGLSSNLTVSDICGVEMLPYNTGKYHETPEGVPMLHAVDHSLTETMLISLSPSSQFMYEPEVMESTTCGQSQGSAGPPAFEPNSGENFLVKSENMISPTVEGLTFQDCVDPDELFSPPADGLVFSDCLQLNECSAASTPGAVLFADVNKQALFGSVKGSEFIDYEKLQNVFAMSLEGVSYDGGGQKTGGSFDMLLEDEVGFEDCNRLDPLITSTSSVLDGCMKVEGMGNDWFELNKDLYEMPEDAGGLLRDPVFSGGPTLTQLNSKDLDSAGLLGDYNLEDLYGDALTSDERQGVAPPSGSVDLAAVISKFPVGVSGAGASPKFTTCTVTSFVTSLSTSGAVLPQQYPTYVVNEPLPGQEPCYSDYGVTELRQKLLTQSQWASIFGAKSGVASIQVNPCCVPVLRRGLQVSDVIGAVVVSGDGSVSLAVSEDPAEALRNLEKHDSANFILDESWKEIERLLLSQSSGTQPADQNISGTTASGPLTIKTEPHDIRIVSPEEMTDKESVFDDSDVENADDANNISDEDVFVGKSDDLGDLNSSGHKDKKYFWQYNTQSKGPKGKRLCKSVETEDPHVLHDFEDPVFDPDQNQTRYKHNGKARRGDGNDVTPNPHKLFVTGNELKKLNKLINDIVPSSEMPASARAKLLKEKNKYASRACRLKKKAQHEANKLKLHGLEHEHRQLMKILVSIKKDIVNHVCNRKDSTAESLADKLETLINENLTLNVAGRTADYVNSVLQKVAKGDRTGSIALDE